MSDEPDDPPPVVSRWVEVAEGIALSIETQGVEHQWIQTVDYVPLDERR